MSQRAEQAVGDTPHLRSLRLEALCEFLMVVHGIAPRNQPHQYDRGVGVNVTGHLYGRRDLVTFGGCGWSYKREEGREGALPMSAIQASDQFTALPDERTLAETLVALEGRGFSVEVVDHLDAARERVLARIPEGSSVMTYPSVTLQATGIAQAVDEGERYDTARTKVLALDRATQLHEIKAIMVLTGFALGSVHAITRDGTLVIASALGSQLASYAWGAANVIFVVGAQKLVPDLAAAHERVSQHCLKLEDARVLKVYGKNSRIGKILEIHQEDPGRIHVVLIRAVVGF